MTLVHLKNLKNEVCGELSEISDYQDDDGSFISFHAEVPASLQFAMNKFIECHPNWDQYRLIQAAMAGFLVQNGIKSRSITRLYISNMFSINSLN